ncbi:MAG: hypothetical protein IIV97_04220, partial [Oscillospiraceae bacterium]|nr:hypothetical protein [Oscillospiraceae bacterium]
TVAIPAQLGGQNVVAIGEGAFEDAAIIGVSIPDTVETIGESNQLCVECNVIIAYGHSVMTVATAIHFGWTALGSFSVALIPIVGQCIGAGKPDQAKMYTKKMSNASLVATIVIFGSIFLLRNQLVGIFNFEDETLKIAAKSVAYGTISTTLSVYSWAFTPIHGFRAAGDVKYGLYVSIITMFVFRVGLAFLLGGYFRMGILGLWIGMWADWFVRAILNLFHFRRGKWLEKKLV